MLNRFIDSSLSLSYTPDSDTPVALYQKSVLATAAYLMNQEDKDALIQILDKYLEWRLKAIENKVKIEKKIDIDFDSFAAFFYGGSLHLAENGKISGTFFSRNETTHELVLTFDDLVSRENEYIDHKPESVYIEYENILEFKKLLSDQKIDEVIEEIKKQNEVDSLFN